MDNFTLEIQPGPNDQEPGRRLVAYHEMTGRTIRTAIEYPAGPMGKDVDVVIVFEDDCWATLTATPEDSDSATITLGPSFHSDRHVTDYLHPTELLEAKLINHEQYKYLLGQEEARKSKQRQEKAARLRAEADQLERDG